MPSADELPTLIRQLESNIASNHHQNSPSLLTKAKVALLHQDALLPTHTTPLHLQATAQHVLELGALIAIRTKSPEAFSRYFLQLQPFYSSTDARSAAKDSQQSKITGLSLLLLLSQGDYAGFHTLLEGLEAGAAGPKGWKVEDDEFIQYPIRLESWLMEGSYDRVWGETKSERVPCEEFAIFSDILVDTIRSEVASCSERAYGSIPVTNAKNLLFLDSEGSVVDFSNDRGWMAKDGRVYFPNMDAAQGENDVMGISGQVIENTLGYARELETIV